MRLVLCLFIVLNSFFLKPAMAQTGVSERLLINAEITARKLLNNENFSDARDMLRRSRAVIIVPNFYRGGFILGAAGGTGVILAKDNSGTWGYPGFVNMGSLSAGLQIGFSGAELIVFVITNEGLSSIINNQVRIGGNAGLSVATFGGDVGGAKGLTTDADYIIYAKSAGLYAGLSLEGSVIEARPDIARDFYGEPAALYPILIDKKYTDSRADKLRDVLVQPQQ
jgi:lipid-binding SYLF domain-containing protein